MRKHHRSKRSCSRFAKRDRRKRPSRLWRLLEVALLMTGAAGIAFYEWKLPPTRKLRQTQPVPYPYGLLLGCGARDDGTPSNAMRGRCDLAISLYNDHVFDTLIVSGAAVKNQYVEAQVMEQYIHERCPDMPIIKEERATSTWKNMEYASQIIQDQPVVIMTGQLHARRASAMAKNFFKHYAVADYPDFKLKHALREIVSRAIYLKLEFKKLFS